ncbi:hypothetical protein [Collinsella bouchesdurhonensis]|uniref:hypothetical protein n=1 Tax=Collinsella bouchesdurhonensis TaxID=1907654 RepID=UPI0034A144DF
MTDDDSRVFRELCGAFRLENDALRASLGQQNDRSALVAFAQKTALKSVVQEVELAERMARDQVTRGIGHYVYAVEQRALKAARKRVGVVGPIQMNRRYAAFLRIGDSKLLLKRLDQTLTFIEAKIRTDQADCVASAYAAAGSALLQGVRPLSDIAICEPEANEADAADRERELAREDVYRSSDLSGAIAASFKSELGDDSAAGDLNDDEVFDAQIEAAVRAAKWARLDALRIRAARAHELVGRKIEPRILPTPPRIACKQTYCTADLVPLLDEVKRAYASYRRFVLDSGMFNAFGSDNRLGKCCGYVSDFSDEYEGELLIGEYCGTVPARPSSSAAIPQVIEEADAPDGDALDVALARMRGFNKRVYRGILDDDPIYFADVFWYGLRKLDQFAESMVKVDEKAWQNYVDNLARAYAEPAEELATGMDKQQLEGFSKAVKALEKGSKAAQ